MQEGHRVLGRSAALDPAVSVAPCCRCPLPSPLPTRQGTNAHALLVSAPEGAAALADEADAQLQQAAWPQLFTASASRHWAMPALHPMAAGVRVGSAEGRGAIVTTIECR